MTSSQALTLFFIVVGFIFILEAMFDISRLFGLFIPRRYSRFASQIGFLFIVIGLIIAVPPALIPHLKDCGATQ